MSIQLIKIGVAIPTLNRADLLEESVDSHLKLMPNIPMVILDNGAQKMWFKELDIPFIDIYEMAKNLGVAKSWNYMAKLLFGLPEYNCTHVIFLNDDVVLGRSENDICAFIARNINYDIIVSEKGFCSFILSRNGFFELHGFDENFYPVYFEDNDFMYRAKLANMNVLHTDFLNPKVFRNSMTLHKDKSTNSRFMDNKNYYEQKWGGEPGKETYVRPFPNWP